MRARQTAIALAFSCLLIPFSRSDEASNPLEAIRKAHGLPALAVVVMKDGKVCESATTGVRKMGSPGQVTIADPFHIGSCTKSMTATLAAQLVAQGRIQWTTTIAAAFPELKARMHADYRTVTLEQLLSHRGGFPKEPPPAAWAEAWKQQGAPTQQRYSFIKSVLSEAPAAPPGTKFIYSNQGYAIAGAMLEKKTGKPWETLVTKMLFEPLGMKSAGFGPPGRRTGNDQPWGHTRKNGELKPVWEDNPPAIGPAGTVHCSLPDLARYASFHTRSEQVPGMAGDAEAFTKLHTPVEGQDYAFGWGCPQRGWAGGTALTHAGSNTMWFVVMWLAPKKDFAVVVGTNVAGPEAEKGCDEVAEAMIRKWLH